MRDDFARKRDTRFSGGFELIESLILVQFFQQPLQSSQTDSLYAPCTQRLVTPPLIDNAELEEYAMHSLLGVGN